METTSNDSLSEWSLPAFVQRIEPSATREAHEKIESLWVRLNCLSLESFKREFDVAERRIKRSRRMGKRDFR